MNAQNKELICLFKVDEILSNNDYTIDETLNKVINAIPDGWRYSKDCGVKLEWNDKIYQTENFAPSLLKMHTDIELDKKKEGTLTIVYTKQIREEKGVFLSGEHQLLKSITSKINSFLTYHSLQKTISELQVSSNKAIERDGNSDEVRTWLKHQDLSDNEIDDLIKVKIDFKKGETIFKQGAIASYIILLSSGLSKNYVEGNFDKGFNFKIIKPMSFIGLSSVYGKNTYAFSGSALTKCTAYLIDIHTFKSIASKNQEFTKRILSWYCDTTQGHLARMSSIANKQALGRLAETILYLSDDIFNGDIITTNVSRKDIAELAAMSTESAVRFLSDLKKDGIIQITSSSIRILKQNVLKLLSNN